MAQFCRSFASWKLKRYTCLSNTYIIIKLNWIVFDQTTEWWSLQDICTRRLYNSSTPNGAILKLNGWKLNFLTLSRLFWTHKVQKHILWGDAIISNSRGSILHFYFLQCNLISVCALAFARAFLCLHPWVYFSTNQHLKIGVGKCKSY